MLVGALIVAHVCSHWEKFGIISCTTNKDNYPSTIAYSEEMCLTCTYSILCEVIDAGQIFPFVFEVRRDCKDNEVHKKSLLGSLEEVHLETEPTTIGIK